MSKNNAHVTNSFALISKQLASHPKTPIRHESSAFKDSEPASKYAEQALIVAATLYDASLATGIENNMLGLKADPIRRILRTRTLSRPLRPPHAAVNELRDGRTHAGKDILIGRLNEFPQSPVYQSQIARLH